MKVRRKNLEQEVGEYKSKAQSKDKGVSKVLKDKLIAYHANDKLKKNGWRKPEKKHITR